MNIFVVCGNLLNYNEIDFLWPNVGIFLEMIGFGGLLLFTYFHTEFFGHKTWDLKNVIKLDTLLKLLRVISIIGIFGGLILQLNFN